MAEQESKEGGRGQGEDRVETPLGGEGSQEEREGEELGSKTVRVGRSAPVGGPAIPFSFRHIFLLPGAPPATSVHLGEEAGLQRAPALLGLSKTRGFCGVWVVDARGWTCLPGLCVLFGLMGGRISPNHPMSCSKYLPGVNCWGHSGKEEENPRFLKAREALRERPLRTSCS